MKLTARRRGAPSTLRVLTLTSLLVLSACSSGDDRDDPLDITQLTATQAILPTSGVIVSGPRLAFLADEGTTGEGGTDFNDDEDILDSSPVVLDSRTGEEVALNVAARDLAWVDGEP